jgi:spore germination protein GerM
LTAPLEPAKRPPAKGLRFLVVGIGFVLALAFVIAGIRGLGGWKATEPADRQGAGQVTRAVALYFRDERGQIVSEAREVAAKSNLAAQVRTVVEEELAGSMAGHEPAIPAGTALHHVFTSSGGLVTIDVSREIASGQPGDMESEYAALAALVRTIRLNFPELTAVQVLIEGKPEPTLAGHFALDAPLVGDEWLSDRMEEKVP